MEIQLTQAPAAAAPQRQGQRARGLERGAAEPIEMENLAMPMQRRTPGSENRIDPLGSLERERRLGQRARERKAAADRRTVEPSRHLGGASPIAGSGLPLAPPIEATRDRSLRVQPGGAALQPQLIHPQRPLAPVALGCELPLPSP